MPHAHHNKYEIAKSLLIYSDMGENFWTEVAFVHLRNKIFSRKLYHYLVKNSNIQVKKLILLFNSFIVIT